LYLTPIFSSIETLHLFRQQAAQLEEDDIRGLQHLHELTVLSSEIEPVPLSAMHGDLHLRNIMVHGAQRPYGELRFRLIDLDRFTRCGDLAYDIGEFTADIEHAVGLNELPDRILALGTNVATKFEYDALSRPDPLFELRYTLARARSFFKLAELRARWGLSTMDPHPSSIRKVNELIRELGPTLQLAYELLEESVRLAES
jgi:hypothetical protein